MYQLQVSAGTLPAKLITCFHIINNGKQNMCAWRLTLNSLLLPAVLHMSWGTSPVHRSDLPATSSPAAPTPEWRRPYWSSDGCLSLLSTSKGPGPTGYPPPADIGTERKTVQWVFERLYVCPDNDHTVVSIKDSPVLVSQRVQGLESALAWRQTSSLLPWQPRVRWKAVTGAAL